MIAKGIIISFSKTRIEYDRLDEILRKYYHFIITPEGAIENGVEIDKNGKILYDNDDPDSILICYYGTNLKDRDQKEALYILMAKIIMTFDVKEEDIHVRDFNRYDLLHDFYGWLLADL